MILGSSDPTPWDARAITVLVACGAVLAVGVLSGSLWPPALAAGVRRGFLLLAVLVTAALLVFTPTRSAIVGAGRLLTLWPAFALDVLLFAAWSWRAGGP